MSRLDKCPDCGCTEIDTSDDVWFCLDCGTNFGALEPYMDKIRALESQVAALTEERDTLKAAMQGMHLMPIEKYDALMGRLAAAEQ